MDAVSTEDPGSTETTSLFKKRGSKRTTIRKRQATPPLEPADSYSSDSGSDRQVKRQRKVAGVTAVLGKSFKSSDDLQATKFQADRSGRIASSDDATRHSNWFEEKNRTALDTKSLLGKTHPHPSSDATGNNGIYKGASQYQNFVQKNPNALTHQVGPIKAPTNIRTITVTDFAPDVCKDYKQTGFCGFGDSCKFLHAREDYKQGWELDKDWEIGTKGKKVAGKKVSGQIDEEIGSDGDDEKLEGIPFACIVCKKPYTNPIITRCGHYFCEACALRRYRKSPSCAACGAGTGGVFNGAKGLKKLLDKKKLRAQRAREKAIANGEDVSDEDEDRNGEVNEIRISN